MNTVTRVQLGDVSGKYTEATVEIQTGVSSTKPADVIKVLTFVTINSSADTVEAVSHRATEQALSSLQAAAKLSAAEIQASIKPRAS
jgi:hypothetical protein